MIASPMPSALLTRRGRTRQVPECVGSVVRCGECNTLLEFSGTGWGCPRVLGHTKLTGDGLMEERLRDRLKAARSRWKAKNLLRFLKRRQRWADHKA